MNQKLLIFIIILVLSISSYYGTIQFNKYMKQQRLNYINSIYGPESFISVKNDSMGDQYNLTYGELTNDGLQNIIKYLEKNSFPVSTFIDLGSGNGKTLALAIVNGFQNAKGVEIVEQRHNFAVEARNKMEAYVKDMISLHHTDILQVQPSFFPEKSVIFISNLLFPLDTTQKIIKFLSDNTPSDTILIVSRLPNNLYQFKLIETLAIGMSWDKNSRCYVLKK